MAENVHNQLPRPSTAQRKPRAAGTAATIDDEAQPHPIPLLAEAGISVAADGTFLLADGFAFRRVVERAARKTGATDELIDALAETWVDAGAFRAMLQPARSVAAGAAIGDTVKDSLIRLLLQCRPVQTRLAQQLLESLNEHQDELESAAPLHQGMPLIKLVLSQFRWLEHIEDGSVLLQTIGDMIQVAEHALRRELVLVLPDVVVDGQHSDAVQVCSNRGLRAAISGRAPIASALGPTTLPLPLPHGITHLTPYRFTSPHATMV